MATAMKCPCGHPGCKSWMVAPQAAVQGVGFTEREAEIVAAVLSGHAVVILQGSRQDAVKLSEYIQAHTPHVSSVEFVVLEEEQ